MCYSCLSMLNTIIDQDKIEKLKEYFIELTPNNRDLITVSKIANVLNIKNALAVQVILKCEEVGILRRKFGIRCPECGALIKELSSPSLANVFISECYCCDSEISIDEDDIVILFELIKIERPFDYGQQKGSVLHNETSIVAQEDTYKVFTYMCEKISNHLDEKRLAEYANTRATLKKDRLHKKAVKISERNRIINIALNILGVIVAIIIIIFVYWKYGFAKISVFISFAAFIFPFGCNYILKEIFLVDIGRIEEKLKIKE